MYAYLVIISKFRILVKPYLFYRELKTFLKPDSRRPLAETLYPVNTLGPSTLSGSVLPHPGLIENKHVAQIWSDFPEPNVCHILNFLKVINMENTYTVYMCTQFDFIDFQHTEEKTYTCSMQLHVAEQALYFSIEKWTLYRACTEHVHVCTNITCAVIKNTNIQDRLVKHIDFSNPMLGRNSLRNISSECP